MPKKMTTKEIDAAATEAMREFLVPYTTYTKELATNITARLRHARLLRVADKK